MSIRFYFLALVLLVVGGAHIAAAQSDSFTVQMTIGSDTQAPTTPTPFLVSPIAATQIDVTWGAATDNTGVVGYQLFRDAIQIATTTLTTYSDIGLSASTTYSYNVVAFDGFGNVSTSSPVVSTTTFSAVVPTTTPQQGSGGLATMARLQLESFTVTPSTNGAKFDFATNRPTRFILRYGLDSVYEDGTVESPVYKDAHSTSLFPLDPGSTYQYELYGYDRFGAEVLLSDGSFDTAALPDSIAPTNATNFSATPIGDDVFLRWGNPRDDDFVYVRVVRNHLFYPLNDSDGFLVYQGLARSVTDVGALTEFDQQYYTIFTYDASGNVSSGAITSATALLPNEEAAPDQEVPSTSTSTEQETDNDSQGQVSADAIVLYASSVQVFQADSRQSLSDRSVLLDSRLPYEIFISAEAVPNNLKTIIVTVVNPSNQRSASTYLLTLNSDQTGYSALVPAPMVVGSSRLKVEMIDYTLSSIRTIEQTITFVESREPAPPLLTTLTTNDIFYWLIRGSVIAFLLFLLYIILFALRRRREDKSDDH
jgi:hypothetical protein